MGTVLVLGSLIAVCGFIAYVGDLLGRRLGKRRLTAFGLRPRYTAVLCTVITGMVIAGTTLGVLMGVSAGVRLAVTRGEALVQQNRDYRQQRDGLLHETARLRQEIEPMRRQNEELLQSNVAIEAANQSLVKRNHALAGSVDRLRGSEKTLRAENGRLETDNQTAQRRLKVTRAEMQEAQRELAGVRRRLNTVTRELTASRADLESNLQELEKLQARERVLRARVERLALSDVIVREGDEMARLTVPAGATRHETLARVQDLVARVREIARQRGAQRKEGRLEAYLMNSQLVRMFGPTRDWPNVAERDLIQAIVWLVAESEEDVVLRAEAVQNTVLGEPVPFDIKPFWNVLAYNKGQEIASTTIDPSQSRGQILEDLAELLRGKVRQASFGRNMIPGPRNELGEVNYDTLLAVMDKVKALGVPAKVGAVAARDVRSADPLELDFYVVPAETSVAARTTPIADEQR